MGGLDIGAASLAAMAKGAAGGGSLRGRGGGGSLRGRGGAAADGRGATDTDLAALSDATRAASDSLEPNEGSEGGRLATSFASLLNDGFERRRGIGGGWLSGPGALLGLTPAITEGSGTSASSGGTPTGSLENEMVGAMGALSALEDASRSGPLSPGGRADGGLDAMFESRLGFGGGASLRDIGAAES